MRTFAGEYDGPGSPDEETLLEATGHPQTDEGQDVRPCQDGEARQVDRVGADKMIIFCRAYCASERRCFVWLRLDGY